MEMAYLGDIREQSISPEGIIWENDNRKEERHYWNGAFIDFCDLPGEDYAKTIFVTSGTGGSPSTPSKASNPITVQVVSYTDESGVMVYAYRAVSKQPVTSDVVVEMTVQDESGTEETIVMTLPSGSASSDVMPTRIPMMMSRPPRVVTSDYNPKEDDKFEYDAVLPEETPELPMAYSITMLSGNIDTITDEELTAKLIESGEIAMKDEKTSLNFKVEFIPVAVEGMSKMNAKELTEALILNAQDIIIVTDKTIRSIEQADVAGINEISLWVKKDSTIVIDGVMFNIWYKRDEGQTSQSKIYDPETNQTAGTENREYIIYYN